MYDDILNQAFDQIEEDPFPDRAQGLDEAEPETRIQNLQRRYPDYPWNIPQYTECHSIPLKEEKAVTIPKEVVRDINWKSVQQILQKSNMGHGRKQPRGHIHRTGN